MTAFGRLAYDDSRDFWLTSFYDRPLELPTHKYYKDKGILDQGSLPACTAYAGVSVYMGSPIRKGWINPDPIYYQAQREDEWPGEDYAGTSIRAMMKVMQRNGYFDTYAFAWSLQPGNEYVLLKSPVIYGTYWYNSMMSVTKEGFVKVDEGSGIAGGHAYVKDGVNLKKGISRFRNSWGKGWGIKGRFWLSMEDEEKLLSRGGELCTPVEI